MIGCNDCTKFLKEVARLRAENERLKAFVVKWFGHEWNCDCLDAGSPRIDCTCGYDDAREQALKGGA